MRKITVSISNNSKKNKALAFDRIDEEITTNIKVRCNYGIEDSEDGAYLLFVGVTLCKDDSIVPAGVSFDAEDIMDDLGTIHYTGEFKSPEKANKALNAILNNLGIKPKA